MEVNQIIRSKRKTIALIVKPDGSLVVRAPLRAPLESIREFVEKNLDWIKQKQTEARSIPRPAPKRYVNGESFFFLGEKYPLYIVKEQETSLVLEEGIFKLRESDRKHAAKVFEKWYREQAACILNERVDMYARQYDFHYQKVGVTGARTRWGSCSASGSLNFSWRLVLAPLQVVDYVIVHELAHTVIHNHSEHFWQKVESVMPGYNEHRKWLQKNGQSLLV